MTWVVDASVALQWFVQEEASPLAHRLLEHPGGLEAPDLILAEVYNAAWRLDRGGSLAPGQFEMIVRDTPGFFATLSPLAGLATRAAAMARTLDHPIYDCFYLALAEAKSLRVVTADRRLLSRLTGSPWQDLAVDLRALTA